MVASIKCHANTCSRLFICLSATVDFFDGCCKLEESDMLRDVGSDLTVVIVVMIWTMNLLLHDFSVGSFYLCIFQQLVSIDVNHVLTI